MKVWIIIVQLSYCISNYMGILPMFVCMQQFVIYICNCNQLYHKSLWLCSSSHDFCCTTLITTFSAFNYPFSIHSVTLLYWFHQCCHIVKEYPTSPKHYFTLIAKSVFNLHTHWKHLLLDAAFLSIVHIHSLMHSITLHAYNIITWVSVPCRMMEVQKQITHPLVSSEQAWVTRSHHGMGKGSSICTCGYTLCSNVYWLVRSVWYFDVTRYVATISTTHPCWTTWFVL